MGLDLEVVFILDDEYSVTRVTTKVACYIPCVRCSRGGESGRVDGGCKVCLVCWVCRRGFYGHGILKGMLLGYLDGI